jgi:histidyl-tRNA synthetase
VSRDHFAQLQAMLDAAGVPYVVNPRLVRGLDYYTRMVFEWITTHLGAQGTICAGGRYDGLVAQLGGQPTPAAGFALGIERLVELLAQGALSPMNAAPQVYLALLDESLQNDATVIAERLRDAGYRVLRHCGGGSLKSQMKKADQSGAPVAVLIARDDAAMVIDIKLLREGGGQERVTDESLVDVLARHIH